MIQRFYYNQGLIIVPTTLTGKNKTNFPVMLAIDTGSFYTNINSEILYTVGAEFTEEKTLLLGVGESVESRFVRLKSISIFNISVKNAIVTSHTLPGDYPIDGLIGNDLLQHYKVTIDFPNHTISFE